jgi:adhesin/invasin
VDWSANQVVPNFTIAATQGTGNVNMFNNNGATLDVVIDAFGYFAPTPRVVLTANPGDIAPTSGHSTITATVSQPDGSPVANDHTSITTAGPTNVCGTLTPLATVTNASGKSTFTYSAGTASGVCTLTVTEASQSGKGTVAVTQGNVIALTSANASVPADGTTTDALTAHVSAGGNPVVGDAVHFMMSGTPAGACGSLNQTTVNTDSSGNAVATYMSSSTAGFCAITATESGSGNTSTTSINQTASSTVATVAVAATPSSITADGTSTSSIAATVTGAASAPIVGDQVMFSVSSGGGAFVNAFATTDASGVATVTYTSSTSVGSFTMTALEANGANSGEGTITQTSIPFAVALSASQSTMPADGLTTSNLTVTITVPGGGAAGAGLAVSITSSGTCGTISSAAGTTAPDGTFTSTYQASTTTGSCTLDATGGPQTIHALPVIITQTASPPPSPAYMIAVTASPTSIQANAAASSTVSATVTTDSGTTPVPGDPVTFTAGTGCGSLSATGATTNASGVATTTLTATVTPGPCQITAVESDSAQSGSTNVTQVPATNAVILAPPGTTNLLGDGSSTQVFTVRLTPTVFGGSVADDTVNFSVSGNPGAACGSVSPTSSNTGTGSTVSATYTSSITAGFCTVTATEATTGASGTALIDQTQNPAPTGNAVAVAAAPPFILANGSATSTITATVTNSSGPVAGDTVQFSPSGTGIGTLTASFGTTNGSGVATVTYTASTTLYATATVTATEANGGASGNATVDQVPNVAVAANPTSVAPSAMSAITVTVTHQGVGVPGLLVGIGASGVCGTVTPNFGNTLQNGTFAATYTSPSSSAAPGSSCSLTAAVQGVSVPFIITNTG